MNPDISILIVGGNDIASAIAHRLFYSGFRPIILASPQENYLRTHLCYGMALFLGKKTINGVVAETPPEDFLKNESPDRESPIVKGIRYLLKDRKIPVIGNEYSPLLRETFAPQIIIHTVFPETIFDNFSTAPLVLGLAGLRQTNTKYHFWIEDRPVGRLGEIYPSAAEIPPAPAENILHPSLQFQQAHAPESGVWVSLKSIGDEIFPGETLGKIHDRDVPSPVSGQLWGQLSSGRIVEKETPVSFIYPGAKNDDYQYFDYRHNAISGAVLAVVLRFLSLTREDS